MKNSIVGVFLRTVNGTLNLSGRASRREYWTYQLIALGWVLMFIIVNFPGSGIGGYFGELLFIVLGVTSLLFFIPSISLTIRRLHDVNTSALPVALSVCVGISILLVDRGVSSSDDSSFAGIAPFLGFVQALLSVYVFIQCCLEGHVGPNRYGADPKSTS